MSLQISDKLNTKWIGEKVLAIEPPTQESDWAELGKLIDDFTRLFGEKSVVVSFVYESRLLKPPIQNLIYWRSFLFSDEETKLYAKGFSFAENYLANLPENLRNYLLPLFSEINHECFKNSVIASIAGNQDVPAIIVNSLKDIELATSPKLDKSSTFQKLLKKLSSGKAYSVLKSKIIGKRTAERAQASPADEFNFHGYLVQHQKAVLSNENSALFFKASQDNKIEKEAVVLIVEDSGSRVNLNPAIAIAKEAANRGIQLFVLSSYASVVRELRENGFDAYLFGSASELDHIALADVEFSYAKNQLTQLYKMRNEYTEARLVDYLLNNLIGLSLARFSVTSALATINSCYKLTSVLSVNEAFLSGVVAGQFCRKIGIKWTAYDPILIFNHPDTWFFPADMHLVYGEQLVEVMRSRKVDDEKMKIVGSVNFDNTKKLADAMSFNELCTRLTHFKPEHQRLVVVGTENRNRQLEEIAPVLKALVAMPGVFTVLKLHPADQLEDFQELEKSLNAVDRLVLIKDIPVEPLIKHSDLLICMRSNINVMAAILGVPTLMCDFNQSAHIVDFAKEGIALGCYFSDELKEILKRVLFDSEFRKHEIDRQMKGAFRFNGPNDGLSASRVVDYLVNEMQAVITCPESEGVC